MKVPDFITKWADDRIKTGATVAVQALVGQESQFASDLAARILGGLKTEFEALPAEVGQLEAAGLQGLQNIPQQMEQLPTQIVQAISGMLPHFLRHMAELSPQERDKLLRAAYAAAPRAK